jgi:APA family basic amino acid/polyamine antiporter
MRSERTAVIGECGDATLCRTLGPVHLVALGIGAIIGAGIFVITGHAAAAYAGPGVVISFAIAGVGTLFAALCYAEYASMIPVAGSAYTYTYATFGRLPAWIVGWNLVLEYLIAASSIAVGWSGYFVALIGRLGISIPPELLAAPFRTHGAGGFTATGALVNVPAAALVVSVTAFLIVGVQLSVRFNNAMVAIKLAIVLLVIVVGLPYVTASNHTPFIPANAGTFGAFGWSGVFRATGVIFFAYIGFDAVSVLAQEARNPQRDMPIGILGSLCICTVLYMLMSYVVTGIAPYASLNVSNPVSMAVTQANPAIAWLAPLINAGAVVGLASVVLVLLLAQSRVFYAMSRDGLIPQLFGHVHTRFRTPYKGTIVSGVVSALLAAIVPLDVLGELISIGTLAAFAFVCLGVLRLRWTAPHARRPFRTPLVRIVAPLGAAICLLMMAFLPFHTWIRLLVWTLIGLAIYFLYGVNHAKPPRWSFTGTAPTNSGANGPSATVPQPRRG